MSGPAGDLIGWVSDIRAIMLTPETGCGGYRLGRNIIDDIRPARWSPVAPTRSGRYAAGEWLLRNRRAPAPQAEMLSESRAPLA